MATPYVLTREDLERLRAATDPQTGASLFDVEGVMEGEEATEKEIAFLNGTMPPVTPVTTQSDPEIVPITQANRPDQQPDVSVSSNNPDTSPLPTSTGNTELQQLMMKMMQQQQNAQPKVEPFDDKYKRRQLAFAALRDAGMALQGKEGNAVDQLMGRFADRDDMVRKQTAAQQRMELMTTLMGGPDAAGAGDFDLATADGNRQYAKFLSNMIMMNPSMGDALSPQIQMLMSEAERLEGIEKSTTATVQGASELLQSSADLRALIESNDFVTGLGGMLLSMIPTSAASEARLDLQTLRSNMALNALQELKASGATLGSVSEKELALLEADIAAIDLDQKKSAVLKDFDRIDRRYKNIVANLYAENAGNTQLLERFDAAFGGQRPTWAGGEAKPLFTAQNVPEGETYVDDNGNIFRYNGGSRSDSQSYTYIGRAN